MNNHAALEQLSIQAAKTQNWPAAIAHNQALLDEDPNDVNALIRMGVAYAQLGEKGKAKSTFTQVLTIDKSNSLAKKHLQKIKNNQNITLSSLPRDEEFIEEPGKTRTVELHRLAGKDQLEKLSVGQTCELKPKNRFVSIEADKIYVGSLPEDLSSRLTKLIKSGNSYACYIQSVSSGTCSVFIKEVTRSKENEFVNSFPVTKSQLTTLNDMFLVDDTMPLQMEDIPLQIVETDADEEKTPDSFEIEEPIEEPVEDADHNN
jgi:hypothetical protein